MTKPFCSLWPLYLGIHLSPFLTRLFHAILFAVCGWRTEKISIGKRSPLLSTGADKFNIPSSIVRLLFWWYYTWLGFTLTGSLNKTVIPVFSLNQFRQYTLMRRIQMLIITKAIPVSMVKFLKNNSNDSIHLQKLNTHNGILPQH
jgi:hypothetical protein